MNFMENTKNVVKELDIDLMLPVVDYIKVYESGGDGFSGQGGIQCKKEQNHKNG